MNNKFRALIQKYIEKAQETAMVDRITMMKSFKEEILTEIIEIVNNKWINGDFLGYTRLLFAPIKSRNLWNL